MINEFTDTVENITSKVEVRSSSISGQGTFAKEDIKAGEFITTLSGESIPADGHREICIDRGISEDDPLQISDETYLILKPASKLINHSCQPNAGLRNSSDLYALREIHPDEELTYDYSTTVGMQDPWSMSCSCGAENCRGRIANVLSISRIALDQYIALDALPDFIKEQLRKL